MSKKQKAKSRFQNKFPIKFGPNIMVGTTQASFKACIDDADMDSALAYELFGASQLDLSITCDPNSRKDIEGQESFEDQGLPPEALTARVDMVSDCKRYRWSNGKWYFGLSAFLASIDKNVLEKFAGLSGTFECTKTGSAATDDDGDGKLIDDE